MKHFYVCTSKIEGYGLNAGENIKRGEAIFVFKGPLRFKINKNKRDALSHPNWVGIKQHHWIEPGKPHKFANHSCNANAGIKGTRTVVALQEIKEGEEILLDYSTFEADSRWEMKCECGESNCRKIVGSIHTLPKEQFNKYLPFIPTYFQKIYSKESALSLTH